MFICVRGQEVRWSLCCTLQMGDAARSQGVCGDRGCRCCGGKKPKTSDDVRQCAPGPPSCLGSDPCMSVALPK